MSSLSIVTLARRKIGSCGPCDWRKPQELFSLRVSSSLIRSARPVACWSRAGSSLAVVERLEEVLKRPVGHVLALLAPHEVGGAEVDALVNAGVDDVVSRVREPAIRAGLLNGLGRVTRE